MTPRPNLNNLAKEVHEANKLKGFHDKEWSNEHLLCLVISELMEAVEADRNERRANIKGTMFYDWTEWFEDNIKDSIEDELADAVIRLLDMAGLRGYSIDNNLVEYTDIEYRSFVENIFSITTNITYVNLRANDESDIEVYEEGIFEVLGSIESFCQHLSIDLWLYVELKMKYNQTRPNKHGKAY